MSLQLLLGLSIVCAAPAARAERAIAVEVTFAAPFDAAQLREAIRVRLPAEGRPVHVRVALTPTGIQVETPSGAREVEVSGLEGAAAARLVALAASDLLLDDLASVPTIVESAAAPPARSATTIGAVGGVAGWGRALGGAGIDVAIPLGPGLFALELAGATLLGEGVHLTAGVARVGGGLRLGIAELRAGLVLAPVFVSDGVGDTTILGGGSASIRVRPELTRQLRAVFAVGVDAFASRTEYRIAGMSELTTPRFAPWFGVGMEVSP